MTLANNIERLMQEKKFTQEKLAEKLGITQQAVSA